MANPDRLSGLDSSFLHLENGAAHMHVAGCSVFSGGAPSYEEVVGVINDRLHLVPRYRQRLAFVPLAQGRPVWVDDPHFQVSYHVRHTALPAPGDDAGLRRLAGRVFSQALDRTRPLWELWLVEGLAGDRFAILSKTHHALVDGVSGVDIATVLFDAAQDPAPVAPPSRPWVARPLPSSSQLLADALLERATVPGEIVRGVRATLRRPRQVGGRLAHSLAAFESFTASSMRPAPPSTFNVRIGPHRRIAWLGTDLNEFKAIRKELGGTVNDVVLAVVAGALGSYLRRHGQDTDDLVLRAMVPVSVRSEGERGALGNRVSAMWVPLPVGVQDPRARLRAITEATASIKESGQAVGAKVLTDLSGFAPATIIDQAARLQARQRLFNLVVTNVPGPQRPLYLLGRELEAVYPMVPLAQNTALGIAIMSYNGQLNFGLTGDFDALADLETLVVDLHSALAELSALARGRRQGSSPRPPAARVRALRPVK